MALFCITCLDNPGVLDRRVALRPDHVAYLKTQMDLIRLAGPQLDADGKMCGSLFVIEAPDRAAAEAFSNGDPFKRQGVFGQVEIRGFTATMGSWAP
jgi:uncharacterized protein YciI